MVQNWNTEIWVVFSFLLGAVLGSFCNAFAWRMVRGESICRGFSHCPTCGHRLYGKDLIPLWSWISQRGRCRYCGKEIALRYVLSELFLAGAFASMTIQFGWNLTAWQWDFLACILLIITLVDLEQWIIPNGLLLCAMVLYGVLQFPVAESGIAFWGQAFWRMGSTAVPLLLFVCVANRIWKTETMGGGDIKLFAVLGLYLGPAMAYVMLFLACVLGIVWQALSGQLQKRAALPFGPAMAASTWITVLYGASLLQWYSQCMI